MLRTSLRSAQTAALGARRLAATPSVAVVRAWYPAGVASQQQRCYVDAPKPPVLPASTTTTAASSPAPTPTAPSSIPIQSVPKTPPTPSEAVAGAVAAAAEAAATRTPPPPPPKKKKGFFRRLRNYVLTISILGALAFGGGVWYSRISDSFHDFFTEYIPYGEQAVLYVEDMDFRKRFPQTSSRKPRDTGVDVRVPARSGASWRVADAESDRQKAAAAAATASAVTAKPSSAAPASTPSKASSAVSEKAADATSAVVAVPATAGATVVATPAFKAPEVDEPSRWPPASPIDALAVADAKEPLVQDVVGLLNDIITVVNADGSSAKFAATIGKAKEEVNKVGSKVRALREAAEAEAAQQVAARTAAFDKAANDLLTRVEAAMAAQEAEWRAQVDAELARVRQSYDQRLQLAVAREQELNAAKLQNELVEQAVQLTQQFAAELRDRVEQERGGRLGRLQQLSAEVADLERLTAGWTDMVDASQRTQQLHVALDAVRAKLSDDAVDPASKTVLLPGLRPFVKELVAVKESAGADPVVDAAIASIPPAAYQRGIASPAELIDRFRRVAAEVRKASLLPEDAGVASHASSYLLSKVLFRKQPTAAAVSADAGDVESILTRTQALLEEGNLDEAAREMNGLKGWAKTLSRDWLGEVRKALEVNQALDVITAEARLRSLQLEKSR